MTQAALAIACGWEGPSRISNYEQGTREPTLADLALIAKAVSVTGRTYEWLAGGQANEPIADRDDGRSRLLRPDPATMLEAYRAALFYIGMVDREKTLNLREPSHMAFLCDLYGLIAQGVGVLPGDEQHDALLASAYRLFASKGESSHAAPQHKQGSRA